MPVLVAEEDDDEDYDEDYDPRSSGSTEKSSSSLTGGIVVVLGLVLLLVWINSRPDINPLSTSYLEGKQVGVAYIDSGQEVDAYTTEMTVCKVQVAANGDPAAEAEAKAAAVNKEAGCKAAFDEHEAATS